MSDHVLAIEIESRWGINLRLECIHADGNDLRWFGHYDEYGQLLDEQPREQCWAAEWADADGVGECLLGDWPSEPSFPIPVRCYFNGDSLVIEHEATP